MKAFWPTFCCVLITLASQVVAQEQFSAEQLASMPFIRDHGSRQIRFSGTLEQAIKSHADPRVVVELYNRRALKLQAEKAAKPDRELPNSLAITPTSYPIGGKTTQNTADRKIDWSVSLGIGTVARNMTPTIYRASWTTPDCVNDYVAYALNVPGVTGGQANFVGINELYSGTNPTGLCGTAPHVNWAYNASTAGGRILTDTWENFSPFGPAPYGTKIAYVESTSHSAIFHVLTWKAGEGTSAVNAAKPVAVGSCTTTSSCLTSVTFSTKFSSTLASPMVDWRSDKAWVASDDGTIYQLSCTFTCALNTNPTVEWSYKLPVAGTGGALPTPTEVGYDLNFKRVDVADSLGEMWILDVSGSTPTVYAGPLMVGGGGCTTTNPPGRTGTPNPCTPNGGSYALDGYIEDEGINKYYMWTGNDGVSGASAAVMQANIDLSGLVHTAIGTGSYGNTTTNVDITWPTFDEPYWQNLSTGHMYFCGTGTTDTTPFLYSIGFSAWPVMDSTSVQASFPQIPVAGIPCSPLTGIYNPNINLGGNPNDHDLLVSGLVNPTNGYIVTTDISNGAGAEITLNYVQYPGGISGTWWDNVSTEPQASSVYFATLGTNSSCGTNVHCAVKLTQLNLN